ncbi:ROK family protein [Actinosynnema sp. NPDC047251]|uniref:2-epi-5-epi-valiolone 7-kinase n=1 Tax=Saccharothrix espanaensis (strain ATCC 51144 / DSM 44229 / JCM 9112 / NBRC 15066 / NRRL 15764) TaxID=1179773 RepID=K0K6K2_SACES|nr:ROK family protein [Saccharothrix espanaensis]CCH32529.1 2-epi-5-epi-valiolone 7-kinase [Saccharothrix espanaensis DSM 44229]
MSTVALGPRHPVLAFDLGGSWWRVGLLTDACAVRLLCRVPAVNHRNTAKPVPGLQADLVDFVVERTREQRRRHGFDAVGVSLGAALNGHTGEVLGSAPLWGGGTAPFNLAAALREALPDVRWTVLNDVSALAVELLAHSLPGRRATAVTVSSGIACRTIDLRTGHIPLDPVHGVQGEIGHLPARFTALGREVRAHCECGAPDHLAAFSSGRGIEALLRELPEARPLRDRSPDDVVGAFTAAVRGGDPRARSLLDDFTRPLAEVLLHQAVLDPGVERTVLSGGVVDGLGDHYRDSLLRNLAALGLYGIDDPAYFARRITRASDDGLAALRGAGIRARSPLDLIDVHLTKGERREVLDR